MQSADYQRGVEDFAQHVRTVEEVADVLGVSQRRVRQLAAETGMGEVVGGVRLFTPSEVDRLARREDGRRRSGPSETS